MKRTADEVLALLDEHGVRLHALLLRLTLRSDVAEDLMQELFCKLVQNERFAGATHPVAYATRMATNLAFDHRRAQRRDVRGGGGDRLDELTGSAASPLTNMLRREELDRVLDAMGRLPRASREIVVLRYLERQDYAAIGRHLGKSPHTVRALCHKGIGRLRVLLDKVRTNDSVLRRPQK